MSDGSSDEDFVHINLTTERGAEPVNPVTTLENTADSVADGKQAAPLLETSTPSAVMSDANDGNQEQPSFEEIVIRAISDAVKQSVAGSRESVELCFARLTLLQIFNEHHQFSLMKLMNNPDFPNPTRSLSFTVYDKAIEKLLTDFKKLSAKNQQVGQFASTQPTGEDSTPITTFPVSPVQDPTEFPARFLCNGNVISKNFDFFEARRLYYGRAIKQMKVDSQSGGNPTIGSSPSAQLEISKLFGGELPFVLTTTLEDSNAKSNDVNSSGAALPLTDYSEYDSSVYSSISDIEDEEDYCLSENIVDHKPLGNTQFNGTSSSIAPKTAPTEEAKSNVQLVPEMRRPVRQDVDRRGLFDQSNTEERMVNFSHTNRADQPQLAPGSLWSGPHCDTMNRTSGISLGRVCNATARDDESDSEVSDFWNTERAMTSSSDSDTDQSEHSSDSESDDERDNAPKQPIRTNLLQKTVQQRFNPTIESKDNVESDGKLIEKKEVQRQEVRPSWQRDHPTVEREKKEVQRQEVRPSWQRDHPTEEREKKEVQRQEVRPAWQRAHSTEEREKKEVQRQEVRPAWQRDLSTEEREKKDVQRQEVRPSWQRDHPTEEREKKEVQRQEVRPAWKRDHSTEEREKAKVQRPGIRPSWQRAASTQQSRDNNHTNKMSQDDSNYSNGNQDNRHTTQNQNTLRTNQNNIRKHQNSGFGENTQNYRYDNNRMNQHEDKGTARPSQYAPERHHNQPFSPKHGSGQQMKRGNDQRFNNRQTNQYEDNSSFHRNGYRSAQQPFQQQWNSQNSYQYNYNGSGEKIRNSNEGRSQYFGNPDFYSRRLNNGKRMLYDYEQHDGEGWRQASPKWNDTVSRPNEAYYGREPFQQPQYDYHRDYNGRSGEQMQRGTAQYEQDGWRMAPSQDNAFQPWAIQKSDQKQPSQYYDNSRFKDSGIAQSSSQAQNDGFRRLSSDHIEGVPDHLQKSNLPTYTSMGLMGYHPELLGLKPSTPPEQQPVVTDVHSDFSQKEKEAEDSIYQKKALRGAYDTKKDIQDIMLKSIDTLTPEKQELHSRLNVIFCKLVDDLTETYIGVNNDGYNGPP